MKLNCCVVLVYFFYMLGLPEIDHLSQEKRLQLGYLLQRLGTVDCPPRTGFLVEGREGTLAAR